MSTLTLTWDDATDPDIGWNLYIKHNSTPNALIYSGTLGASARSNTIHNVGTGLYTVGLSRIDLQTIDGSSRQVESAVAVQVIYVEGGVTPSDEPSLTGLVYDPNAT